MNDTDLERFRTWFEAYTQCFGTENEKDRENISLKIGHTRNVCRLAARLAKEETGDAGLRLLAETAALFHDVGRFPQYMRYRTFRDSVSVNHGKLGAETLEKEGVLEDLPERERRMVLAAVRFHNAFSLPAIDDPQAVFLVKLVRDADKLDIWRIFLEFYESGHEGWKAVAGLGLPDLPGYSEEMLNAIAEQRIASLSATKSLNDFKLLQLSWIFDLNFDTAVRLAIEGDIIGRFIRLLPEKKAVRHVLRVLNDYSRERLDRADAGISGTRAHRSL